MPYYYTFNRSATTNGTGNTCSNHLRLLTIANQQNCNVVQLMAAVRNSTTAGSGILRVGRSSTAGGANLGGGTTFTPEEMNQKGPAAETTAANDASAFTNFGTTNAQFTIGYAQTGGQGGWVALERDNAVTLNAAGGVAGNMYLDSFTATASQLLEVSGQFLEG